MRYNHAIDLCFEFITDSEDPINKDNLDNLVEAARRRLDSIVKDRDIEAFGVIDTYEEKNCIK